MSQSTIRIFIEHGSAGLWYATSPDLKGLLVAEPAFEALAGAIPRVIDRGGIIRSVEVIDIVQASDSPWFFGPRGLVLRAPEPHDFIQAVGQFGHFK